MFKPHARYRYRPRGPAVLLLVLVALFAIRLLRGPESPPVVTQAGTFRVQRVVDGDTLLLAGGEHVRLIGIDTPETTGDHPPDPFGPEADAFTRRMVEGRDVRLEFDRERLDQYGRTLAYVYVDDLLLNEEIVRQGYSHAETRFRFRADMQRRFRAAEAEAARSSAGVVG